MQWLAGAGYEHYEISKFCRPGFRSRHNSSYWQQKKYLGFGPSPTLLMAMQDGGILQTTTPYIQSINNGRSAFEKEVLTHSKAK
jgi:oxygen-independent coproporphyrinogen-3 oxidase